MEAENTSTFSAKPPPLTSDQLNYLIWRYLQESGYGEAAVKLQRDWKVDAESLPFAKGIKGHALVSLVQKGLRYHHLSLTIDENGRPSRQLDPSMFFFGPESDRPPQEIPEEAAPALSPSPSIASLLPSSRDVANGLPDAAPTAAPKRGRKTAPSSERNGSATRKPLAGATGMDVDMINGHAPSLGDVRSPSATEGLTDENVPFVNGAKTEDPMDVDEESVTADQPIHDVIVETVPPPLGTLVSGASIGVQVAPAKVANLGPSTRVVHLPAVAGSDKIKSLTRVSWRPGSADCVSTIGDDFCGVWSFNNRAPSDDTPPPFRALIDSADPKLFSAMAWDPVGDLLAVATYSNHAGEIHLLDGREFTLLETLPASQRAVTSLKWQGQDLRLLGIAPYDSGIPDSVPTAGSSILLWDVSKASNAASPSSLSVPETLVDLDCARVGDNYFVAAAGQNVVYLCQAGPNLVVERKWTSPATESDQWSFVRCAWQHSTGAMVIAASADSGFLWMPMQDLIKKDAHDGPITGLEIRPAGQDVSAMARPCEWATSSMDGTVKVWHYDDANNSLVTVCKLILGQALPIMTLAYSPDGFCLAGASYDTIRIWNAAHGHNQMAMWQGATEAWNGSRLRDDDMMSVGGHSTINGDALQAVADHALVWDSQSARLALGLGSQVALIDFQR